MKSKLYDYQIAFYAQVGSRFIGDNKAFFYKQLVSPGDIQDDAKLQLIVRHGCKTCRAMLHKIKHHRINKGQFDMYYSCECFSLRDEIYFLEREARELKALQ